MSDENKPEYADRLIGSIDRLEKALYYLADTVGMKVDALPGKHAPIREELDEKLPGDVLPPPDKEEKKEEALSFDDFKASVNSFGRLLGKEKTFEILARFAPTMKLEDVKEDERIQLGKELGAAYDAQKNSGGVQI